MGSESRGQRAERRYVTSLRTRRPREEARRHEISSGLAHRKEEREVPERGGHRQDRGGVDREVKHSGRAFVGGFIVILVVAVILSFAFLGTPPTNPPVTPPSNPPPPPPPETDPTPGCKGTDANALCYVGTVTHIVDGDTLDVGDYRIRLVLVDAPERGQSGFTEATNLLASTCPVGSQARVDEDDWQIGDDPYGRVLAVVTCGGSSPICQ